MTTKIALAISCIALLALAGCRVGARLYKADAVVAVGAAGQKPTLAQLDSEVAILRALAPTLVGPDQRWQVRSVPDTALIHISVITPDPVASAVACNQLTTKYVTLTNGTVVRWIVEQATGPSVPMR